MPRSSIVSRIVHDTVEQLPRPAPLGTRWWETLPLTFSSEHERFSLAMRDALPVRAGATSDVVLRTLGACLIGGLAAPLGYRPKLLRQSFDDVKLYGPMAESGDATRFFARPPHHVAVETHHARLPLNRPKDGLCEDLHFESPFVPVNPGLRKKYLANERNRRAHVRLWRHHDGPRPTVIAVHGFSADLYHLNEWFFALPWLYAVGCDVALFTMPFHGKRQSRMSPFSGHGFFAGGASHINEAFGQAICDLRVLIDHLIEERGVPRVGITGVSLGGFTSALLATVEPRLAFALPNVPVTSIPDLVLEWQPMGAVVRAALAVTKRSIVDVRYMLAVSSPLTYQPVIGRERLMIIGGVGDRLAPPKHARLLWEHWDRCRLHWFPGNHLIHLDRGAYLRETGKFLGGLGFFEGLPARAAE